MTMRDGTQVEDIRLGRLKSFDERSRSYSIGKLHESKPVIGKGWSVRHWLDQGYTSECVSFSMHHEALAVPARAIFDDDDAAAQAAHQRFHEMQLIDEWSGEDPDGGTSVLAGAKVMHKHGYFDEYRWAFNLRDVLLALSYEGPVVMGTDWHEDMYDPDSKGYIHPSGGNAGGHAYLLSSVSTFYRRVTVWNSWGYGWGMQGRAYLKWDDLEELLYAGGEACVPVGRHVV